MHATAHPGANLIRMTWYSLELSAKALHESRLRGVGEYAFQLSGMVILRIRASAMSTVKSQGTIAALESAILDLLSDKRPWRRKRVFENVRNLGSAPKIYTALQRLESGGEIKRARHGVYLSAEAPLPDEKDIPPLHMVVDRPSFSKAVDLLREPKSSIELQEALGVSRQRVDQIVKSLMRNGTLLRSEVSGERGAFIYILSDMHRSAAIVRRNPKFHVSRARLLSALSPDVLARASDVAAAAAQPFATIGEYIKQLAAGGFILGFKLGRHRYVVITPRGIQHPQYDKYAPKAAPADIVADLGETRIRFIELLSVLSAAATLELTYAMPTGYFDSAAQKASQIVQRLERAGIVEEVRAAPGEHPKYRLTELGHFVASVIRRTRIPPAEQELIQSIAKRRAFAARQEAERRWASPTQKSILTALQIFGRLSAKQLNDHMEEKFSNCGSIYFAMRTLTKRGAIRRVRLPGDKVDHWELT
jgi:DNA-binding HxlR family transcriptional regulator